MKLNVNTRYSNSSEFEYETHLVRLNLDEERKHDVLSGNGFIVSAPKAIKDDVKDPNGIFSTKYGPGLQDANPFGNRYRCKCGHTTSRFYHGLTCEVCGTKVEFKDDNFQMFGYIVLKDPYHLIHPNLYNSLASFIGEKEFMSIITPDDRKDEDGHDITTPRKGDNEFTGIGLIGFYERFDDIMNYYRIKRPAKQDYYDDIMANRDKVFIQSIPVYTIHLRPYKIDGGAFHFEGTNALYNILARLAGVINNDKTIMSRKNKPKNQLLIDMQKKYQDLYGELVKILSGKKGTKPNRLYGSLYRNVQ